MSTVLLMTDAWQPTVLRILPFSNNNARALDKKVPGKGTNSARGFPVLAVTRSPHRKSSSDNSEPRSAERSATSQRSEANGDCENISVTSNVSGFTAATEKVKRTNSSSAKHRKYAKKKVPDMHSEMKEAMKFSVQDINDQLSSASSLNSNENKDETKEKHSRVDSTRTRLPKPSLSSSPELRSYYSPVNGVRRSVPLTPGELELQRIRDTYYVEQVQRQKKYKLNVNQLPRSTTPINEHDPDKLNMKQVIAFLQTKTTKESQRKVNGERKTTENGAKNVRYARKHSELSVSSSPSPKKMFAKDSVQGLSRSNSEIRGSFVDKVDNTRQIPGCLSVMSTKSSPNLPCSGQTTPKPSKATSIRSTRSFRERSKDKKSERQKPAREFKLYRFLAIAPDGQSQGMASTVSDAVPTIEKSIVTQELRKSTDSPHRLFSYRNKDQESRAARVLHRHAINRGNFTPPKAETKENSAPVDDKAIRLPLMADAGCESPDNDSDTCSTTSATCHSIKCSPVKEDRSAFPKKGKAISFDEPLEFSVIINSPEESGKPVVTECSECYTPRSDISVRTHKTPGFPRVNISPPKQIRVNLPNETKKVYSNEIVRLTLRQDKNTTRVTSYMSDLEPNSARWNEQNSADTNMASSRSTPRGFPLNNHVDDVESMDVPKHSPISVSNNSFIKVRQKLKASNV